MVHPDIEEVLVTPQAIATRVHELALQVASRMGPGPLHLIGVLKGAVPFLADLARALPLEEVTIDFISVSSYADSAESSGRLRLRKDLDDPVLGRRVLVVEDIIDTGHTLSLLRAEIAAREPAQLAVAALLDKPARRRVPVDVEFVGFTMDDRFLVGYGLDFAGRYRHLPYVGALRDRFIRG